MIKPNPFTPRSGEEPRVFLNRNDETDFFKKRLNECKNGRFNHYVINGEWGIGKTALLKYLKLIAQQENCLCAYFVAEQFERETSDILLSVHILQSIVKFLPIKPVKKDSFLKTIKGFGIQVFGSGFNLTLEVDKNKIVDSQILLQDGLRGIWDDVKEKTELIVILIDDVQNFKEVSRIFTTLKNVLSSDEILNETRFLFVLSSTIDGWEQFIVKNHPVGRYFIPRRELNYFNKDNAEKLIYEILDGTGVRFSEEVIDLIFSYTNGHLFEIHALCSALYDSSIKGKVDKKEWEVGFEQGLLYLGNAVFENRLLEVSEKEKETMLSLSFFDNPVVQNEISNKSKQLGLHIIDINKHLRRLTEKRIIENPQRGIYFIKDRLFREYIKIFRK